MKTMKRETTLKSIRELGACVALAAVAAGLLGCETMKENPMTTGAIVGAGAGAATGALADDENRARNAAIGAGVGAAVGLGAGYAVKKLD